ncbi:hypothetical protein GCM10017778_45920 [Streptomyces vinaceus]|nr:hypothetical protein GCM10017778_45920 [Streptomyces vinaceus]
MKEHQDDMDQSREQAQGYGSVEPCFHHPSTHGPLNRPDPFIMMLLGGRTEIGLMKFLHTRRFNSARHRPPGLSHVCRSPEVSATLTDGVRRIR